MYIEGRHDKSYSEKLHDQLFILGMLIWNNNELPGYLLDNYCGKAERTYRRYFRQLHESGLIPEVQRTRSKDLKGGVNWRLALSQQESSDDLNDLLEVYCTARPNPRDRLYRCGRLLIFSLGYCYYRNEEDEEAGSGRDWETVDGISYYVPVIDQSDMYVSLSARCRQRDHKLVRQVLLEILKSDN